MAKRFKRGDIIVSGRGNVGIFTDSWNEAHTCFDRLTGYGTLAGTDPKYARYASKKEKEDFFKSIDSVELWDADDAELLNSVRNKKRWRPSLALYRTLKNENEELREEIEGLKDTIRKSGEAGVVDELKKSLDEQMEGTSTIVKECDAWRDKYRSVVEESVKMSGEMTELREENTFLKNKNATLEQSNTLMETELRNVRYSLNEYKDENDRLKNRGFFARLFNA